MYTAIKISNWKHQCSSASQWSLSDMCLEQQTERIPCCWERIGEKHWRTSAAAALVAGRREWQLPQPKQSCLISLTRAFLSHLLILICWNMLMPSLWGSLLYKPTTGAQSFNPLMPELNPSEQCCLLEFLLEIF